MPDTFYYRVKKGSNLEKDTRFLFEGDQFLSIHEQKIKKLLGLKDIKHLSFIAAPAEFSGVGINTRFFHLYEDREHEFKKHPVNGVRFFKKNSNPHKAWVQFLKDIGMEKDILKLSISHYAWNFPLNSLKLVNPEMDGYYYLEMRIPVEHEELESVTAAEYFQAKANFEKEKNVVKMGEERIT
ncbi:hypothetical protein NST12_16490 [Bacillus sp. FSL W8-1127]|uniref:hypothetical protein n=1 Tax=Bacillus sp. FSL W8-1127 TaxID=2954710 RepID=UPI0030FD0A59